MGISGEIDIAGVFFLRALKAEIFVDRKECFCEGRGV